MKKVLLVLVVLAIAVCSFFVVTHLAKEGIAFCTIDNHTVIAWDKGDDEVLFRPNNAVYTPYYPAITVYSVVMAIISACLLHSAYLKYEEHRAAKECNGGAIQP